MSPAERADDPGGGVPTEPDFDELEPGVVVTEELKRLVHHPGQEAHRLRDLADAGESGSTPFGIALGI